MPERHDRRVGDTPLRQAHEAAGIGTWDWDLVRDTIIWSPEMYRILGIAPGETDLYGAWLRVLHPEDRERAAAHTRANLEASTQFSMEFRVVRATGEVRWVLGRGTTVRDPTGKPTQMLGINMDITDRHRAEESLAEETRALETLNRVGTMLAAELDLERLVQAATDAATELTGAQFGAFFHKVDEGSGQSVMLYALSGIPRDAFAAFPMPRHTPVFGPTLSGAAIVRADDITADPRYGHNPPHRGTPEGHPPVRSHLGVPVITRSGEVLGGMFFGHERAGVFTERSERLAAALAAHAAIAIDNARLLSRAQRELSERTRIEDRLRELNEKSRAPRRRTDRRAGRSRTPARSRGGGAPRGRGGASAGPKTGGARPAHRRDRARLQQSAHRRPWQSGTRARACKRSQGSPPTGDCHPGRRTRRQADPAITCLFSPPAARAPSRRSQRADRGNGRPAAAHIGWPYKC